MLKVTYDVMHGSCSNPCHLLPPTDLQPLSAAAPDRVMPAILNSGLANDITTREWVSQPNQHSHRILDETVHADRVRPERTGNRPYWRDARADSHEPAVWHSLWYPSLVDLFCPLVRCRLGTFVCYCVPSIDSLKSIITLCSELQRANHILFNSFNIKHLLRGRKYLLSSYIHRGRCNMNIWTKQLVVYWGIFLLQMIYWARNEYLVSPSNKFSECISLCNNTPTLNHSHNCRQ